MLILAAAHAPAAVAVVLDAIGRDLRLDDGLIVGVFEGFGVVGGVHHVQVVVLGEDHGLVVGRNGGPGRFALRRFIHEGQLAGAQLVLEVELLLVAAGRRGEGSSASANLLLRHVVVFFLFLLLLAGSLRHRGGGGSLLFTGNDGFPGDVHGELDGRLVLDEPDGGDGQVLRVVGDPGGGSQAGRELYGIEDVRLGFLQRVDHVELAALVVLEGVPEAVAGIEPVRSDGGIEDQLADLGGDPLGRQLIIGFRGFSRAGGDGRVIRANARKRCGEQHQQPTGNSSISRPTRAADLDCTSHAELLLGNVRDGFLYYILRRGPRAW